jgi:hypothetical protein
MSKSALYARLYAIAHRIQEDCAAPVEVKDRLRITGHAPQLPDPEEDWLFPLRCRSGLSLEMINSLLDLCKSKVTTTRQQVLRSYHTTLSKLVGLGVAEVSDEMIETTICRMVENQYGAFLQKVRQEVLSSTERYKRTPKTQHTDTRKASIFSNVRQIRSQQLTGRKLLTCSKRHFRTQRS